MAYTKDNLRQIFQQPFNANEWQKMLHQYFRATELRAEPECIDGTTDDEQGYYLGAIDTTDSYRIGLFYYQIQHGNVARKRVGLRNLVKSFVNPNWGEFDAALVVFDSGTLWRLSFVSDIKGESTAPKRYTYVFGEDDNYYNTPVGRFDALQRNGISFENIKDAFSVEALSKEFFDEYREHYADIVEYITGKRYVKEKGKWVEKTIHEPCHQIFDQFSAVYKDPEKTVRDYIKKLMGRLVFLQFLQKKGWMGVPADRQDWTGGDTRFLQNKFNEFANKDNFIDGFLEPLFNDLNTNRQNRGDIASPKVGDYIKVPFLNGGLFQLDEEDCTDIRLPKHLLGDVLEFFERYNFTIDENDPNDAQVGVDPEMLGRVFENLLEDNKDKGAFYTPKEIVQYMCQESLIAYLQTGLDEEANKESIRQFVLTHEAERLGTMAEDISIKLLNVKICDPAIGSGAFPMGLLRQLYLCQCAIHPELAEKNAADIKRHIIQNNIYGVDIEKGAVDIARLRFWLSLIVDEETPRFLPNLDFKIMQGNSLLEQYKGVDLSKMTELSSEQGAGAQLTWFDSMLDVLRLDLRQKLDEYYNCSDHNRKEHLKQEIIDNVKQQLREQSINVDFGDLNLSANDQFTLWHTWFYDVFSQGGFDIVIGNPPYISAPMQIANERLSEQRESLVSSKKFKSLYQKWDLYIPFIELGTQLNAPNGICTMIVPFPLTNQLYAKVLRKMLVKEFDLFELVDLKGTKIFDNATVSNCIPFIRKTSSKGKTWISSINENWKIKRIFVQSHLVLVQDEKKYIWNVTQEKRESNRHNDMHILGDYCYISKGMVLHSEDGEFTKDDLICKTKDSIHSREYVEAKDISRYTIKRIKYLEYGTNRCPCQLSRPTFPELYDRAKIVMNCLGGLNSTIGNNLLHNHSLYCAVLWKNLHNVENKSITTSIKKFSTMTRNDMEKLSESVNLHYLLGVMNSTYASVLLTNLRGDDYHIYPEHIRNIPIPPATPEQQKPIIELVDKILNAKRENPNAETSSLEQQIDLFVYHLYGLSYEEVLIVEPKIHITQEEFNKLKQI